MDGPRWHLRGMPDLPPVDPGHPDLRSPARFLGWIARGQRGWIAQGVVWGIVWMVSQALVPYALGRGLQAGVARRDTHALVGWALVVLVLAAATAGSGVLRHRVATVNFVMTSARCTQLVLRQAAALGPATRDRFSAGEVATLANADGATVSHLTDMSARFGGAVVSVLLVSVLLLLSSPLLGVVVLVGLALSVLVVAPVVRPLERRERATRALLGDAGALSADLVLGLRVLRGVGGEELLRRRFVTASQRVRHAGVRASRVSSGLDGLEVLLPGLYVVVVTWVGARLALDGRIDAGQLVTAYGWSAFLVLPVQTFVEAAKNYAAATAAAGRIVALLATPVPRPDPPDPVPLPAGRDLHDPQTGLTAGAGRLTAVAVDDPHAGSALADRLGGWGPGGATLGGVPLAALATAVLRAAVVVADREPVLLAGTLAEGLDVPAAGPAPSADQAFAAAAAADVQETVGDESLPARGRTLSGGQRQRLALARALRTGAPVLVLDEPTSAVDAHTEARVASALSAVRDGLTTVVVTTSPPLLDVADEVVWVSGGTVTARGAHRDLLRSDAAYRSFVTRELS